MKNLIKTLLVATALISTTVKADVKEVLSNSYKVYSYGKQNGTGSGFVSEKLNGHIITNKHVIRGANVVKVQGINGKQYYAKVVYKSAVADLAILKLEHAKLDTKGIKHCEGSLLGISEEVYNFGNPAGLEFIYTKGYISGIPRTLNASGYKHKFLVHNLIGFSGQSGSALLDSKTSCLAGVVTAGYMQAEIGFSIPIEIVDDVISDFKEGKNNVSDIKTIQGNSTTKVVISDKTYFDQEANILYLKRTEINYERVLTLLVFLLCLIIYRRKTNEQNTKSN